MAQVTDGDSSLLMNKYNELHEQSFVDLCSLCAPLLARYQRVEKRSIENASDVVSLCSRHFCAAGASYIVENHMYYVFNAADAVRHVPGPLHLSLSALLARTCTTACSKPQLDIFRPDMQAFSDATRSGAHVHVCDQTRKTRRRWSPASKVTASQLLGRETNESRQQCALAHPVARSRASGGGAPPTLVARAKLPTRDHTTGFAPDCLG